MTDRQKASSASTDSGRGASEAAADAGAIGVGCGDGPEGGTVRVPAARAPGPAVRRPPWRRTAGSSPRGGSTGVPVTRGPSVAARAAQPSTPVAEWDAPTGLDSGDPRCLR
ncbi:hypothetical protein GCM10010249_20150 [Streptomyces roseolilacinus]|uniref:Uncharacterized protein n=1 Tax=Streptomyces roseolilacinus TaxID=66904 RepID=A0A918B0I2_9ACTN|nr:hypothetical protein GCM10010249_20150 [Streptomyces roseolilacinus]